MTKRRPWWLPNLFGQCFMIHHDHLPNQELKKQCTDLHNMIDTVKMRNTTQQNESIIQSKRSISCQFTSNTMNSNNRYTTNDQSTWFHQQLMIVEENDQKMMNQPSRMYIKHWRFMMQLLDFCVFFFSHFCHTQR